MQQAQVVAQPSVQVLRLEKVCKLGIPPCRSHDLIVMLQIAPKALRPLPGVISGELLLPELVLLLV